MTGEGLISKGIFGLPPPIGLFTALAPDSTANDGENEAMDEGCSDAAEPSSTSCSTLQVDEATTLPLVAYPHIEEGKAEEKKSCYHSLTHSLNHFLALEQKLA